MDRVDVGNEGGRIEGGLEGDSKDTSEFESSPNTFLVTKLPPIKLQS
jgi:hypothetical protein